MTLDEHLDAVVDRNSFLAFVYALVADREDEVAKERASPSTPYGAGANGWEHSTIEEFLFAAVRRAEDSGQPSEEPSWRAFAEFLYGGKVYE